MKSRFGNLRLLAMSMTIGMAALAYESTAAAQPMSGSINQNGWTFNWEVDSTSGVRVREVRRNGVMYLFNGSMPAIRVQYDGNTCGPYVDRIKWDNIVPDGSGNKVRVTQDATWLRVWVKSQIASYALEQGWWFHKSQGTIVPSLASSGLQCVVNHRHHPYWRMDMDVSTSFGNRVQTVKNGVFTTRTTEFNDTKANIGNEMIIFPIANLSIHANIIPGAFGANDGTPDAFANWDWGPRAYPANQNDPYAPGSPGFGDPGDLEATGNPASSNNGENIDNADVVLWYTAHLPHAASAGPNQWGNVGPWVILHGN